jgi:phosphatidylglycerol:prolipoprotein diacylglycerol transferase
VVAGVVFCRRHGIDFWLLTDLFVPTIPPGLGFGRLGNFINGELYGRPSGVPWAMVFPGGGDAPRHPSQIYEMALEGLVLFLVLWFAKDRVKTRGLMIPLFLVFYGVFRFLVEFTREPDPQLGFILGPFTMGQALSSLMVVAGAVAAVVRVRSGKKIRDLSL